MSKMCHNLSDKSVRAATVVGSWAGQPGIIPHEQLVQIFTDKSKRPKGNVQRTEAQEDTDVIFIT